MELLREMVGGTEESNLVAKIKKLNRDLKNNKPPNIFVKWVGLRDRVLNGRSLDKVSATDLTYLVKKGNSMNGVRG